MRCRVPSHAETLLDGTALAVKHCHDNSHAQEDRDREKKVARKSLCLASVICVIFMVGEILGEFQRKALVRLSIITCHLPKGDAVANIAE